MKLKTVIAVIILSIGFALPAQAEENPYTEIFESMSEEGYARLCQIVWYESALADCPMSTNIAVVETVLNRCLSEEFPSTVERVGVRGQFYFKETPIFSDAVTEAIEYVKEHGLTVLPSTDYVFFATKKQSIAQNHIWIGGRHADGRPLKGKGMYFGEAKR